MAKVFKCDRCGSVFEDNSINSDETICKLDAYFQYRPLDICDKCITSFMLWWDESKKGVQNDENFNNNL